jgi:hypothetical protein
MNAKRFRVRQVFWLDMQKEDEFALAETIDKLKQQRTFVRTIRDGVRLILDLRAGRVDVLLELFPFVRTALSGSSGSGNTDEVKALKTMLEQFIVTNSAGTTYHMGGLKSLPSGQKQDGPKAMNTKQFDLPRFDDEDDLDTLIVTKDTSTDSAQNFINSLQRLQQ